MGEWVFLTAICPLKKKKKSNILFLSAFSIWAVLSSGPVCVREQRHGKVVFQQSCMKFNLLSQKALNPFYAVILSNLVPKWDHLEQKNDCLLQNPLKTSNDSCPPPKKRKKFPTLWGDHPEKHDCCFRTHNPASPTCLRRCGVMNWRGYKWTDMPDWSGQIAPHCSRSHLHTLSSNLPIYWICKISHHPSACQHEHCPAWVPPPACSGRLWGGGLTYFSYSSRMLQSH